MYKPSSVTLNTTETPRPKVPTVGDLPEGAVFYFLNPEFGNGDHPNELYMRSRMTTRQDLKGRYTAPEGWVYAFRLRDGIQRIRPSQWEVHPLGTGESVTLAPNL